MKESEVIFLRGYQRSGTNWVCNILNLHPDIKCFGEFHLQRLFQQIEGLRSMHAYNKNYDQMMKYFYDFVQKSIIAQIEPSPIVCDRTPVSIGSMLVPDSKYIIISRDGRDVLVSWIYHVLRTKSAYYLKRIPELAEKSSQLHDDHQYFEKNPCELLDCEEFFREVTSDWKTRVLEDRSICDKVDEGEINLSYYWIAYESLVSETEKHQEEIYDFLGVNPKKCPELSMNTRPGYTENDSMSHYRKGEAGAWKKYFTPKMAKCFDEEAREALEMLNYRLTADQISR